MTKTNLNNYINADDLVRILEYGITEQELAAHLSAVMAKAKQKRKEQTFYKGIPEVLALMQQINIVTEKIYGVNIIPTEKVNADTAREVAKVLNGKTVTLAMTDNLNKVREEDLKTITETKKEFEKADKVTNSLLKMADILEESSSRDNKTSNYDLLSELYRAGKF